MCKKEVSKHLMMDHVPLTLDSADREISFRRHALYRDIVIRLPDGCSVTLSGTVEVEPFIECHVYKNRASVFEVHAHQWLRRHQLPNV